MKKLFCIILFTLIAIAITACVSDTAGGENDMVHSEFMPPTFELPRNISVEEFVMQAWETRVENILQTSISRVEYSIRFQPLPETKVLYSGDIDLIERWKSLLTRLDISVIPYQTFRGSLVLSLNFYEGENQIQLFAEHPRLNVFHIEEGRVGDRESWKMLQIDNIDEVRDEFSTLIIDMGMYVYGYFVSPEPFE